MLSNTVLFGISTFSSKVLSFLLTRLYTSYLDTQSFGIVDLVVASSNLLIPLVSLGISNAVIRFGLEKGISKQHVFSGGLLAIASGFGVLLAFLPLIGQISLLQGNLLLMYVYVLISCLRTLCCQFVRAKLYTKLYAIDGILSTLYTLGFNILFLVGLNMGSTGYLLSIICADALSVVFLSLVARLWQYIRFKGFDFSLYKTMLRYSLPLVPALMFWWVTNASDRYFISYMWGPEENGLYAAAYKIPTIVTIMSTIFTEAWQLSAVTDGQGLGRERFFSQVYSAVMSIAFLAGGGLIFADQFIMRLLVAPDYYIAWRYVPILIISSVFASLVAFLNSVYMVEKKSKLSLLTIMVGAIANIGLNFLFIPRFGPNGAAFATFLSYLLVFLIRVWNTRSLIRIEAKLPKVFLNTLLLFGMTLILLYELPLWPLWCGILLGLVVAVNIGALLRGVRQVLQKRKKGKESHREEDPAL
ncbi:polysaccharide biosynthesis C-terminal domain-containing protein [Ruminococcaceae bacterium OttesenSCG-928-I18]|nr:polysaccharide biosynthesis C-terminal domain-containing protein [Ruminococcaceae bacterium OttesenSCG-928-I18]